MTNEQVLAVVSAIKEIGNSGEHSFNYQPEPSYDRIIHSIDGVSESLEKINSSLVDTLVDITSTLDEINSSI